MKRTLRGMVTIAGILGGFLSACSTLTVSLPYIAQEKTELSGCIIGYDVRGLRCLSLQTGRVRPLWSAMRSTDILQVAAPVIDWETSTLYYIDTERQDIMKWQLGEPISETLYHLPLSEPQLIYHIEWLLLTPTKESILFMLPASGKIGDTHKLMEYHLYTGESKVIKENITGGAKRPAWVDKSKVLMMGTDIIDITSGQTKRLFQEAADCSISPDNEVLLVDMHIPSAYAYHLYEFLNLRLIKTIPWDRFKRTGKVYFVDEHRLISVMRGKWNYRKPLGTYLFDLQKEQWSRVSNATLRGMYFSPMCPSWIEW